MHSRQVCIFCPNGANSFPQFIIELGVLLNTDSPGGDFQGAPRAGMVPFGVPTLRQVVKAGLMKVKRARVAGGSVNDSL